jgi:hypothetical protein
MFELAWFCAKKRVAKAWAPAFGMGEGGQRPIICAKFSVLVQNENSNLTSCMNIFRAILFSVILLGPVVGFTQQIGDTTYTPPITSPAYKSGDGPVVSIDEAHSNFHTKQGRFGAFARLLTRDGYDVRSSAELFSQSSLTNSKVLVIANALHSSNREKWTLPTPSAFTDEEIDAVNTWVKNGGSLLLIADHMPFPGAAEKLAASFGFKFKNGFAMKKSGNDVFKNGSGLQSCPLTEGRNVNERVTSLRTFTGQAFEIPAEAKPIVVLSDKYSLKLTKTAWDFKNDCETISAENMVQGAYMVYGKGRVVVFGEAAMFTAQKNGKAKVGMNDKGAEQNFQFVLNTIHWLDGILN